VRIADPENCLIGFFKILKTVMILRMKKKIRNKNQGNSQNLPQKLEPKVLTKSENRPAIVETL
jgi:hypothetical protein